MVSIISSSQLHQSIALDVKLTLDRRQAQFLRNLRLPDLARVLQRHAANQLRQVRRARNRRAAAKRFEFDVADRVVLGIDPDLELHHVAPAGQGDV